MKDESSGSPNASLTAGPPAAIRRLPADVVARIAAGEVIERPTSVAKELIENSLDAGARRIVVDVEGGVERLLRISDDGHGMSSESACLALERHATSKITAVEDLHRLTTLGFRGEGLASVAAVSRLTLLTASAEGEGARLEVEGGDLRELSAAGRARGTTIEVRDIFFNTPARRKFQRAASTELQHLAKTLQAFALVRPDVAILYRVDGREILNLPEASGMAERMRAIYGRERAARMLPVAVEEPLVRLEGFLGAPEDSRVRSDQQTFFINGRWVQSPLLRGALKQAYGNLIPHERHPFAVLAVAVDPARVDVNVHPTKREVRFSSERDLYPALVGALKRVVIGHVPLWRPSEVYRPGVEGLRSPAPAAGEGGITGLFDSPFAPLPRDSEDRPYQPSGPEQPSEGDRVGDRERSQGHEPRVYPLAEFRAIYTGEGFATGATPGAGSAIGIGGGGARDDEAEQGGQARADLWQLHRTYILASIKGGLLIIDQHAAHERVLFEETLLRMQTSRAASQEMLFPRVVELTAEEFHTLLDIHPTLEKIGFHLELFGGTSVLVNGIPAGLTRWRDGELLHELIAYYADLAAGGSGPSIEERVARSYACRSAVKAGEPLTPREMNELVDRLFATTLPQGDPHGRPTLLRVPIDELHRRFGRSG